MFYIIVYCFFYYIYSVLYKYFKRDTLSNNNSNVVEIEKNGEEWHSLSCMSDSTDQSAPVNFDMYNRVTINKYILYYITLNDNS